MKRRMERIDDGGRREEEKGEEREMEGGWKGEREGKGRKGKRNTDYTPPSLPPSLPDSLILPAGPPLG